MGTVDETAKQIEVLASTMEDMRDYLGRLAQGCEELPAVFQSGEKKQAMETLAQIVEGLGYYQQLLPPIVQFLSVGESEEMGANLSISSVNGELGRSLTEVYDAVESEDYSLVADLVEYELCSVIQTARNLLEAIQQRYLERVG